MADTQDGAHGIHVVPDEHMGIARYLATRLSTLKPPMNKVSNPFSALMLLNKQQWLFVIVGCPCLIHSSIR
jgi:SHS family lactate transporter-like MFS transporter